MEPANRCESAHIWAPFVYQAGGRTYMFYTGLTPETSQFLCMAEAIDPELKIWRRSGANPILPLQGFDWQWQDPQYDLRQARDPHVVQVGDFHLLAYTTMHRIGCPAVGGLISSDLEHWDDIGPILYRPMGHPKWMPESVNIQPLRDGTWALIPSQSPGLSYYISADPFHWHGLSPQQVEYRDGANELPAGLEVLRQIGGDWLVAYFENERLFIGILETINHPWRLRRVQSVAELGPWLDFAGSIQMKG